MSSTPKQPPAFLTLPPELRNAIYAYVFPSQPTYPAPSHQDPPSPLAQSLQLEDSQFHGKDSTTASGSSTATHLLPLLTSRQFHTESHLLALSTTTFHLSSSLALPDHFDLASRPLSPPKLNAIKHLTLTAKISHLRALNETWAGLPFGHPCLNLEELVVIPQRPDASHSAYAHIADLSQAHTLAYVFGETFKNLRNVKALTVVNDGCFKDGVFELCYRSLVYRMFRWGGVCCGVKFQESGCEGDRVGDADFGGSAWFKVFLEEGDERGREVGEEVCRLVGVEGLDPREAEAGVP